MPKTQHNGIGRGLGQMLSANTAGHNGSVREIALTEITARADQPRKNFDATALQELAASIEQHGILEPIIVRPLNGKYEIIAGERRFRAAEQAGLKTVPVLIRTVEDAELPELQLIENLQREDLDALEEAEAFRNLADRFALTQEEIANRLGKSRVYVANTLRLLNLPEAVQEMLKKGSLTPGHARAILRLATPEQQIKIAEEIVKEGLSVRAAEALVQSLVEPVEKPEKVEKPDSNAVFKQDLEDRLQLYFGGKIKVSGKGKSGKIELYYHDNDELNRLLEIMGLEEE